MHRCWQCRHREIHVLSADQREWRMATPTLVLSNKVQMFRTGRNPALVLPLLNRQRSSWRCRESLESTRALNTGHSLQVQHISYRPLPNCNVETFFIQGEMREMSQNTVGGATL